MATQSQSQSQTPPQNQQIPGMEMEGDNKDAIPAAAAAAAAAPEDIREDQVQNAVRFLSHPKVRNSPVLYRRSFLEKKGLTTQEIDEAFRRVPDPPPSTATNAQPPASTHVAQPIPSTAVQPPTPQPTATALITPAVAHRRFTWYHIVLATGILAAGGAGTALFFKRVFVPRIKAWIKRVASEREDEAEKEEKQNSKLAEEAAEAAKAAASAAALVAKASQDLLSSRNEEKGYFEAFMRALDVQVKEMKLMGEAIKKLEHKRDNGVLEDQFHHSATRNGPVSNVWGAQPVNMNGIATSDYVRPSSAPGVTEPVNYKSYMEMMSMGPQKNERAPAAKPWETAPLVPTQRPNYAYAQSQSSDDGSNAEIQEPAYTAKSSYPPNGTKVNTTTESSSEPWWRKKSVVKIAEAEAESDEPKQYPYGPAENDVGLSQTQVPQRRWVPPQPPPVAMPEAAAAIRQPKPKSNVSFDEGADDAAPSGEGVGLSEGVVGPSNGVEIVEEGKVDDVEANQV
ncbi:Peroxisomal membrane protein PEX14 [Rhynchospora pubera]|uniref:Peroxisomal membrane protein PEX14 n=1 Tax=Rhynchospora pubera TaxID=906938 RepID=A0AAV8CBA6_9POAL|nr:Peroxisomal membrane protein PEX14 [Rhynchospora pubera]